MMQWFMVGTIVAAHTCFALGTIVGDALVLPGALAAMIEHALPELSVLMVVAVLGAWIIEEGAGGATGVYSFAVLKILESMSSGRARRVISSVLKLAPGVAFVCMPDGEVRGLPVASAEISRRVLLAPPQ